MVIPGQEEEPHHHHHPHHRRHHHQHQQQLRREPVLSSPPPFFPPPRSSSHYHRTHNFNNNNNSNNNNNPFQPHQSSELSKMLGLNPHAPHPFQSMLPGLHHAAAAAAAANNLAAAAATQQQRPHPPPPPPPAAAGLPTSTSNGPLNNVPINMWPLIWNHITKWVFFSYLQRLPRYRAHPDTFLFLCNVTFRFRTK